MITILIFSAITAACSIFASPEEDIKFEDIEK